MGGPDLNTGGADMSVGQGSDMAVPPPDGSVPGDAAVPPTDVTINQINTDTGDLDTTKTYRLSGVVVTGIARFNNQSNAGTCIYNAYVQDPAGPAPSGILVTAFGATCNTPNCCPFPPSSNTALDALNQLGDEVTIVGRITNFTPFDADAGVLPTQHQFRAFNNGITKTGTGTVTPVEVTGNDIALFAKNGMGYKTHENMLVTIRPAAPTATAGLDTRGDFTYAGAFFSGRYRFFYRPATPDGGTAVPYPADGTEFTSITGIAQPAFGGGISPRIPTDFVAPAP